MKKTFKLDGLDCANCAAKMERTIAKMDGVDSVVINFMTAKMVLEAAEDKIDKVAAAAESAIKNIESDVIMKKV